MNANEVAQGLLDSLSKCSSIADELRNAGVKGKPFSTHTCPIAKLIRTEVGDDVGVCIGRWSGVVDDAHVSIPEDVSRFIGDFDRGEHPDLIA